jgi:hypothetical protein
LEVEFVPQLWFMKMFAFESIKISYLNIISDDSVRVTFLHAKLIQTNTSFVVIALEIPNLSSHFLIYNNMYLKLSCDR